MNIMFVNAFYYPNMIGGTESSVKLLAEKLIEGNHCVSIVSIDNLLNEKIKYEEINKVKIYRLNGHLYKTNVFLFQEKNLIYKMINKFIEIYNFSIKKDFESILNRVKPDIIHTNNLYGLSPIIWKLAFKHNIKIVHTLRDYWLLNPVSLKQRNIIFINYIVRTFFKKQTKYVDYVTAPSQFTLNKFLESNFFKNAKHKCVVNAVDINYELLSNIIDERKQNNSTKINFIFVGALELNKGIINLLNVFSNYMNDNITLTICGSGKLENEVRSFAENDKRITYLGQLSRDEINNVWIKNDVCIVPSIWEEPFGRVVIEANQYGLPVIGSNKGGISEIINNIHTGELFQYDDLNELKEKIIKFSNREYIKKYYDAIEENISFYSVKRQIKEFENIYQSLLKDKQ